MNRLFYLIIIPFASTFAFTQPSGMPPNARPGKCYAKCLAPSTNAKPADTTYSTYYRYIGAKEIKIVRRFHDVRLDATGRVVERVAVDVPKKPGKLPEKDIVVDTMPTYFAPVKATTGGFTQWYEIVCGSDMTDRMVKEVTEALRAVGYTIKGDSNFVSASLKKALVNYQHDNELPVGQLDFQTLDALGVDY